MTSTTWEELETFEFRTDRPSSVYLIVGGVCRYFTQKIELAVEYFNNTFSANYRDDDAKLLEQSKKNFADGNFLGVEKSKKFMDSILNART